MISPASSSVSFGLFIDQPLQSHLRLGRPCRVAGGLVKTHEATRQEPHALAGLFPANSQYRAQVHGESSHALLEYDSQQLRLKSKCPQKARTEAVESIVAAIIVLFQPP